jgi:iron(III) transport system ATP-binding protein
MSMLELHAVSKSYGPVWAVDKIDLAVQAGGRMAIVGASGCGKTTLLRLIAGFEAPDSGSITLNGQPLVDGSGAVPAHKRGIGFLPQDGALFPHLTVAGNIGFALSGNPSMRARRIGELVELVALDQAMLKRWPHELSGGQQQRVALARALGQRPRLMLLDEPFSALDTGLRTATRKAVSQVLAAAGVTTILVTHDQAEAFSFADRMAVMRDGRLVQVGTPMELYLRPRDEATAAFLGEAVILTAQVKDGWAECSLGRISVDDRQPAGAARIMLRPEQLELSAPGSADDAGCLGIVTEIDFSGHDCMVAVQPAGAAATGGDNPLFVRSLSIQAPAAGALVRIKVTGPAHILI